MGSSLDNTPSPTLSHHNQPFSPHSRLPKAPHHDEYLSPGHTPINPNLPGTNLDSIHINLNVPVVMLTGESIYTEDEEVMDPTFPQVVYDPLFQTTLDVEDVCKTQSNDASIMEEEVQIKYECQEKHENIEPATKNHNSFHDIPHNVIMKPMHAIFQELL